MNTIISATRIIMNSWLSMCTSEGVIFVKDSKICNDMYIAKDMHTVWEGVTPNKYHNSKGVHTCVHFFLVI